MALASANASAQTPELTSVDAELAAEELGSELLRMADTATKKPGAVDTSAEMRDLAEIAAARIEVLGDAVAADPDSDESRAAYAAPVAAFTTFLATAETLDSDVTESDVQAWMQVLRTLEPRGAR